MILAQAFSRFVLDLDGVVWALGQPLPGAPETVRGLRDVGKRLAFVTNNSSESPETYAKRLAEIGAGGDPAEVVTSADAMVRLLERAVPGLRGRAAFVIGGPGLIEALQGAGLRLVEGAEAREASLVVVGWDRALTYEKLRLATIAVRSGVVFAATNADPTYPAPDGLWPGCGAIVAALRASTGAEPLVAGKPAPEMLGIARERLGGEPALVVGDRVDTDILAAQQVGWPSALVLTGATGVPELAAGPAWPDFVIRRLSDLLRDLPHPRIRPATGPDLPPIATILHEGGLQAGAARERVRRTVVAEANRRIVGTAAWEPVGEDVIVRSVAVDPAARGTGVGTAVTAAAVRGALESGARACYLMTESAEEFFAGCGFRTIPREDLPGGIADHPQVVRECPSSAPVMRLGLRGLGG